VSTAESELKARILELLKKDVEFRYAVAGLIGLEEVLRRLDRHEEELKKIWEEIAKLREDMMKGFERHDKELVALREEQRKIWEEIAKLREDMVKGFERHDREIEKLWAEIIRLREDFNKLYEKFLDHDKRLLEHGKRLSRIELELGALSESFYCKALWDDLREEIQRAGERVVLKKRNALVGEEEVDMLVVTDRRVYVVEVKVKPKHEDVGRLVAKADVARKHYPDREVVAILAGAMIGREIEEYAREKNILVYQY